MWKSTFNNVKNNCTKPFCCMNHRIVPMHTNTNVMYQFVRAIIILALHAMALGACDRCFFFSTGRPSTCDSWMTLRLTLAFFHRNRGKWMKI